MHVLVATDGNVDAATAADFAGRLAGPDGNVTVLTVISIPRRLLRDLREVFGERPPADVEGDAEYVGMTKEAGDAPIGWPGDSAMIGRYLSDKEKERCSPVADALVSAGVQAATRVVEGEQVARAIMAEAAASDAGAIVIGSHGEGRFEGVLGSTGTKLARHSSCPVLVLRSA